MYHLVVFASGSGTTLQSIIDAIAEGSLKATIELVVSNHADAFALQRAKKATIPTYVIAATDSEEMDQELALVLQNYTVDLIVGAGYLKKFGNLLLEKYRIINTHPALLPKFGGKGMYGMKVHTAVWEAKETFTGPTIHFVNQNYDEGNIIIQTKVEIKPEDTPEVISQKVQAIEKIQLVETLKRFAKGEL